MNLNKTFFADPAKKIKISYADFIDDIKSAKYFRKVFYSDFPYDYFKQIVLAALSGGSIVLADKAPENINGKSDSFLQGNLEEPCGADISNLSGMEDILGKLKAAKNFSIGLFTSGTAGLPKMICHNFRSLARSVKIAPVHSEDVWAFAYAPAHMAGIQVFFQALMNANTIVNVFGLPRDDVLRAVEALNITHISATPTFFRGLLPPSKPLESVVRITSGGEAFDAKTIANLKKMFVRAKTANIYASTEAGSLLVSEGEFFKIPPEMKDAIKIEAGELLIHKSLLGESLSATGNPWFRTGDMVELAENGLFRFVSRLDGIVNSGGYKVNPLEVEAALRSISGIAEARVYGKKNRLLGEILCADIVSNDKSLDEASLRMALKNSLQNFKIPRIFNFVDSIELTRTGKISRKL